MLGQLAANIVKFFIRKKWIFFLCFAGIVLLLVNGIRKINVEEDIYSIFPKGEEYKEFSEIIANNNLNRQIVFSLKAQEDVDRNYDILDSVSQLIEKDFKLEIKDIEVYRTIDESAFVSYLQSASIALLDSTDYVEASKKVDPATISKSMQELKLKLQGTSSLFMGQFWAKDPLAVLTKRLGEFATGIDSSAYEVEDGIIYANEKSTMVFFGTLKIDTKNTDELVDLDAKMDAFKDKVNAKQKKYDFDYFGTFQIAAQNAVQVKKDTSLTLMISLGLIVLLLIIYYRSFLAPFYFIFPAIFGVLCGVGMVGYIHPEISAISLATAGILLGIVLDYSFHFFTHYKHSGDISETVKEIAAPMLVGSFTTVAAFAALLFTDSVVLQNFGMIALFTLMGAALFTILFLPVLVSLLRIKLKHVEKEAKEKAPRKLVFRIALLSIVAITVFFLIKGTHMNFDADLNNLSYHPSELKEKEDFFTGINPETEKKIYVFAKAQDFEKAKEVNFELFQKLNQKRSELHISELVSIAPYLIPQKNIGQSEVNWKRFWNQHPSVENTVRTESDLNGFSSTAFNPFFELIKNPTAQLSEGENYISELGLKNLSYSDNGNHSLLTSIVVNRSNLAQLKKEINEVEGTYILDLTAVAEDMLNTVQSDFNFLLIFSSLLVFFSLLAVYGRIELAMLAFFPMIFAWIWILGLADFFDVKFNFVNIIIATFIFGLGDDYSIFITDGLIQKYKTNKDSLSSYRSAIILSGITTIFGTGAMYFAKHPAIHSIGLISVIGISTILLITLYIQPAIFKWFVTRRTEKKRGPITFFTFVYSCFLFTYFFVGSLVLTLFVLFILFPLPARKKWKRSVLNFLVSKLAMSTLYAGFQVKKVVLNRSQLDYSKPSIIIANHSSFLDILAVLMLHPKTIIMVKKWVYNSPVFGVFIRYAGYIFAEEGAEGNLYEIQKRFDDGYSLVIFPEGTRSTDGEIQRFHKGAFYLSQALNVPIQPLLISGIHNVNAKNDVMINRGHIFIKALERQSALEGETYSSFSKRVLKLMRSEYDILRNEYEKSRFWFPKIMQNYVLKGPILEWYVRVKYKLEAKNFEKYDAISQSAQKIYDVGCGYGYLSYYLHYRNSKRTIIGFDYDEEKVLTAQNGIKKNDNLQFQTADLRDVTFDSADAIFLNDVLHYLPGDEQSTVLQKCADGLTENGTLFIRDGIIDSAKGLKNTKRTELLSTKFFNFNKSENDMVFLSIANIQEFAAINNLHFEMEKHSKTTSNVLFILRKQ